MRETQLALSGLVPEQQAHKCWKALSMKKRWQWNSETALEDHVVAKAQTYSIGVKEDLLTSPQRDTATRISGVCAPGHNIFTRWCKLSICLAPSRLAGSVKMLKSISYDIYIYIYIELYWYIMNSCRILCLFCSTTQETQTPARGGRLVASIHCLEVLCKYEGAPWCSQPVLICNCRVV